MICPFCKYEYDNSKKESDLNSDFGNFYRPKTDNKLKMFHTDPTSGYYKYEDEKNIVACPKCKIVFLEN